MRGFTSLALQAIGEGGASPVIFSRQLAECLEENNFAKKLLLLWSHGKLPPIVELIVLHDKWCEFLNERGLCKCNPYIYDMKENRLDDLP